MTLFVLGIPALLRVIEAEPLPDVIQEVIRSNLMLRSAAGGGGTSCGSVTPPTLEVKSNMVEALSRTVLLEL